MNTALLCAMRRNEVDCVNVAAILIRFDDGKTVVLTEESLRKAGLQQVDAHSRLEGWLRTRADEFAATPLKTKT
jgi:hypothetical protein